MKRTLVLLATVLLSQSVFAQTILGSSYEQDHQDVIIEAIGKHCSVPATALSQISTTQRVIKVDQGITDIEYTTDIRSREYVITVVSYYSDFSNPMDGNHYSVIGFDSSFCE
ncbi:MAG: hypothetical protein ACKOX6_18145 [Bdellovibrio sp.]